jgi:hypothetical protein
VDTEITSVRPLRLRTGYHIRIELGHERVYKKMSSKKRTSAICKGKKSKTP